MPTLTKPLTRRMPRLLTRARPYLLSDSEYHDGISLDFVRNRFYVKAPSRPAQVAAFTSLFTFTGDALSKFRGSSGLLIPSATNTPRIEYDVNGVCLGLLIEGARTNLCLRSEDLTVTWTTSALASRSKTASAPDGSTNGTILTEDGTNTQHSVTQNAGGIAANVTRTLSAWVKRGVGTRSASMLLLGTGGGNFCRQHFNLDTATVGAQSIIGNASIASASITPYANGWYHISVTGIHSTTVTLQEFRVELTDAGTTSYQGDGVSQLIYWGVQLEDAPFRSSYIPTTTVSVTRANDDAIRTASDFAASSGTMYAEVMKASFATSTYIWAFHDGANEQLQYSIITTGRVTGNCPGYDANAGVNSAINVLAKGATAFATNDAASAQAGTVGGADASVTLISAPTSLRIGRRAAGNHLFGHIRRLDYWPERFSNDTLQRMTT